jgi:hypothetical protein
MADDNTSRSYRSNDQFRRAQQPSSGQAAGDPLAELARLIGQSDPFADFGRDQRNDAREQQQPQPKAPPPMSDWRKAAAAMPAYEPLPEERAEETVRRQPPMRSEPRFDPEPPVDTSYPRHDPYQMSSRAEQPADPQDDRYYRHEPQLAADPYPREETESYHQRHGADAYHQHQQDDRAYAAPAHDAREQQQPYFEEGAAMTPQDEESYDDPPRARRHGGLLTAVTLIGCAMIGTAGAYGYRTYYVAPSGSKTPPVIIADTRPDKVVSAGDNTTGKVITSRVGEPGGNERVVSREEQPVEIRTPPASGPRVVLPAPVAPSQSQSVFPPPPGAIQPPAASGPGSGGSAAAGSATGSGEPKRIRTVTIRPDGNDLSGRPVGGVGQPSTPAARQAPAPKAAPPAARGNSNNNSSGPISLDPQTSASAQPPAAGPRDRQALQPPAPQAPVQPPAPRVAAVQPSDGATTGSTGRYAVQLSSQRSEAEALAAVRSLQAKYPSQLGGRPSFVKRVEISGKGTYYRAMVGPFSSSAEASQFCSEFKAAGGQCLVPRD